jgi:hypothetical protein
MSRPQFHSTDLFILRHAWLSLRDKHMLLAGSTRKLPYIHKVSKFFLLEEEEEEEKRKEKQLLSSCSAVLFGSFFNNE